MGLFLFIVILFSLIIVFHITTKKFLNPYKLIMVFGKKGSGKTALMAKIAVQNLKRKKVVFSNIHIPGTYLFNDSDIGRYEFPEKAIILLDEAGMTYDNREYKSFKPEVRDWFKLQRHYKNTVYLFSQTFDIDKKLRDLTDEMYLIEKRLRVFSYAKRINKRIVLNKSTADSPSKIDEDMIFDSFLLFLFGSRRFTFIPRYVKYFDSFTRPPMNKKEYEYTPPLKMPKIKKANLFASLKDRFKK